MPSSLNKGFTLIEMVIYVSLFSLIISGLVAAAYFLWQSAGNTTSKVAASEEINFVLKKFDWALNGAKNVSTSGGELNFDNDNISSNISVRLNSDNKIEMEIGGNDYILTTENVEVQDLDFDYDSGTKLLSVTLRVDGVVANLTKFLKI